MKFKVGDRVRIKGYEEEWRTQPPIFLKTDMGEYCGTEFTIKQITKLGYICHKTYYWNEDWLELIVEEAVEVEDIEPSAFEEIICLHQKKKG